MKKAVTVEVTRDASGTVYVTSDEFTEKPVAVRLGRFTGEKHPAYAVATSEPLDEVVERALVFDAYCAAVRVDFRWVKYVNAVLQMYYPFDRGLYKMLAERAKATGVDPSSLWKPSPSGLRKKAASR